MKIIKNITINENIWNDIKLLFTTSPVWFNFDLIISGTADKAYVQDSNYASSAWSNIRYKGVKYNSYKIITTRL